MSSRVKMSGCIHKKAMIKLATFLFLIFSLSCSDKSDEQFFQGDTKSEDEGRSEFEGDFDLELEKVDLDVDRSDELDHVDEHDSLETGEADEMPVCSSNGVYPCLTDFPFEYTSDKGEFRLGSPKSYKLYGSSVWKNWIAFWHSHYTNEQEPDGIFLFDFIQKSMIWISNEEESGLYPFVNDNMMVWLTRSSNSTVEQPFNDVNLIELANFSTKVISDFYSEKHRPMVSGQYFYWKDRRAAPNSMNDRLYSINEGGEEVRIENMLIDNISYYDVFQDKIAFIGYPSMIGIVDRSEHTERNLPVTYENVEKKFVKIWKDFVYWSDNRLAIENQEDVADGCQQSIIRYNLKTDEEELLIPSENGVDMILEDVWEDWLVYADYSEGGGYEGYEYCSVFIANSNLKLRYLPSGEEWVISNAPGRQWNASMWGNLIVWQDSRENPSNWQFSQDLYGIDLCMHPELKSRFSECENR